jgi:hypothetical protein
MPKKERCGDCLYWEHRAEAELDLHTGYCSPWEMLKRDAQWCDRFKRRTARSEQEYYNQLYNDGSQGEDEGEEGGGGGGGGPFPDDAFPGM